MAPLQVDNSWYEELNAECYGMALHLCPHVPIPPAAATAILVAGVVTTAVLLHIDVFYTHMEERSALLLCIIPTKGTSFVFATCCLLIFLHSSVLLCKLKALSTYVSKMTLAADA